MFHHICISVRTHFFPSHWDTHPATSVLPLLSLSPSWSINTLSSAVVGCERRRPRSLSVQQSSDLWGLRLALTLHLGPGSINDGRSVPLWMEGRDSLSPPPPPSPSPSPLCPVIISVMETSSSPPGSINSAGSGDSASPGLWWEL